MIKSGTASSLLICLLQVIEIKWSLFFEYFSEIDVSIELSKKAVLVLSYGIEKILGNASTDIGDNPAEATATNTFFENLGLENLYRYTNSRNQRIHSLV